MRADVYIQAGGRGQCSSRCVYEISYAPNGETQKISRVTERQRESERQTGAEAVIESSEN